MQDMILFMIFMGTICFLPTEPVKLEKKSKLEYRDIEDNWDNFNALEVEE